MQHLKLENGLQNCVTLYCVLVIKLRCLGL